MARYTSSVDICRAAAYKIGTTSITNIETPTTVTEERLSFLYDRVRRYVLRVGIWHFAQKIVRLTCLSEDLPNGFSKAFLFPEDFIRFMGLVEGGQFYVPPSDDYMIANGRLYLANETNNFIWLKYISDFKNVSAMDDCFIDAFILRLAYELAFMETTKTTLTNRLLEEYEYALLQAKMVNGQEHKPKVVCRSSWLRDRNRVSSVGVALPYRTEELDI